MAQESVKKKLKVYKLVVNKDEADSTGVSVISLVNDPAVERNFVAFNKDGAQALKFAIQNEELQIVSGPVMIANMQIFRKDPNTKEEYYVYADKATIYSVVEKYFKGQRTTNVNLEHSRSLINGAYIMESFVIDKDRGIQAPKGFEDLADGSWFASMKIEDAEIWSQVKAGTFKGFSIEGFFDYNQVKMAKIKNDLQLFNELRSIVEDLGR